MDRPLLTYKEIINDTDEMNKLYFSEYLKNDLNKLISDCIVMNYLDQEKNRGNFVKQEGRGRTEGEGDGCQNIGLGAKH